MLQTVAIPTPPPTPAPQQPGRDLGNAIRGAVDDALAGALAPARAALQQEIAQMNIEREALRNALSRTSDRGTQRDLERRIERLDDRIEEASSGLAKLEERLTTRDGPAIARGQTFSGTGQAPNFPRNEFPNNFDPAPMVIAIMGILFVAFPLTLTISRFLWKRATNAPAPPLNVETARRFDRLEQSVDAIAIEVERISENQRYLTRLLGESSKQKIGS